MQLKPEEIKALKLYPTDNLLTIAALNSFVKFVQQLPADYSLQLTPVLNGEPLEIPNGELLKKELSEALRELRYFKECYDTVENQRIKLIDENSALISAIKQIAREE